MTTPVAHPQSNGQCERMVQSIKHKLKVLRDDKENKGEKLSTLLSRFLLSCRTTKHEITGETPAKLLMNRELRIRLTLLRNTKEVEKNEITERIKKDQEKQRKYYSNDRNRNFQVGEKVMAKDYRNNKISWSKAEVIKKLGKTTYQVKTEENLIWKRHVNQMISRKDEKVEEVKVGRAEGGGSRKRVEQEGKNIRIKIAYENEGNEQQGVSKQFNIDLLSDSTDHDNSREKSPDEERSRTENNEDIDVYASCSSDDEETMTKTKDTQEKRLDNNDKIYSNKSLFEQEEKQRGSQEADQVIQAKRLRPTQKRTPKKVIITNYCTRVIDHRCQWTSRCWLARWRIGGGSQ